ncbi:enoyl-CoA hydratase [Maritimibacter sp. 55A14]|uniref:enoyl-CoA hydratase/isomerase family protein n=1 Tax=Maritimibacter sp. 55A14 TaxID=2174844 RepID=UPI000D61B586|nr:enoyl-CoA hydratase/isomerase family protein [Maritimibacter sp. 55A14]PWE30441.1 enoyl-CoA hydratase [Maritimibacter sp. 55A14]
MSGDIHIRQDGRIGRITLTRPKALNALSYEMCTAIEAALDAWATDETVAMLLIDAEGDKAFCAGGDIAQMHATGMAGDYTYGRQFWRDEYRMNAKMHRFPKPVASLMQGFTMGGGVGVGCHGSHRVVGDSSRIAMPECSIGLIPDVGGSHLLAHAPGRLGEFLGTTGSRMGPGDALHAGFADYYLPEALWPDLTQELTETGDWTRIDAAARPAPDSPLAAVQTQIDRLFSGETAGDCLRALRATEGDLAQDALRALERNAPLSVACTVELIHRQRGIADIFHALALEYRFTHRSMEHADFIEGIRAMIIDKDKTPHWRHAGIEQVTAADVSRMLMPLGAQELKLEEELT